VGSGSAERQPYQTAKRTRDEILKLTIPAHKPIKRSTLSQILKQARMDVELLLDLL
jgi:hypothetical protein